MDYLIGYSLAGKDKGKVYYILEERENDYLLCDGKRFLKEKPKRKNKKHIQLIKKYSLESMFQISDKIDISNEMINKLCKTIYEDIQEVK